MDDETDLDSIVATLKEMIVLASKNGFLKLGQPDTFRRAYGWYMQPHNCIIRDSVNEEWPSPFEVIRAYKSLGLDKPVYD